MVVAICVLLTIGLVLQLFQEMICSTPIKLFEFWFKYYMGDQWVGQWHAHLKHKVFDKLDVFVDAERCGNSRLQNANHHKQKPIIDIAK